MASEHQGLYDTGKSILVRGVILGSVWLIELFTVPLLQTGDPDGTGKGGKSIWGEPFNDEIRSTLRVIEVRPPSHRKTDQFILLKFNNRGVVAMANAGPDTNK